MVTGYDPAEHGGDLAPWHAPWLPEDIADVLAAHWAANGPPLPAHTPLMHLFLGPAATADAARWDDPHGPDSRRRAAAIREQGRDRRDGHAQALAVLAIMSPDATAEDLARDAAAFLAPDLHDLTEDFCWAVGDLLAAAGSIALDRPTLAGDARRFAEINILHPRTKVHADALRQRWAMPADIGHPTVLDAVAAWEAAGADPQRASKWTPHGVWHPTDAIDYHRAGVPPHLATQHLAEAADAVTTFCKTRNEPKRRRARIRRTIHEVVAEAGFRISDVGEATDHTDPAVVATCLRLAQRLNVGPVGRYGLAQRVFARVRPLARQD